MIPQPQAQSRRTTHLARVILALGLLGLTAASLPAQTTNDTSALLEQISRKTGRVDAVFTGFVQERHLALFQEPLRSEGYLCFQKPGHIRWEITQPYHSILLADGKGVAQFEWTGGQWKKLELGLADAMQHVVAQIGAVMEGRYAARQSEYSVNATNTLEGPQITLTPRQPALRKMLAAIEIQLAPDFLGTRRVVLREADGDYTEIRFSEQVAEPALPAGTFDLNHPAALEEVRKAAQSPKNSAPGKPGSP
jgi:outer membrane lipoprotein-sorting protein